jgi:hypothetical protein
VVAPVVDPPTEVELAPGTAPAEARHAATAADLRNGTQTNDGILALLVGVLRCIRKQSFDLGRLPGILLVVGHDGGDGVTR